MREYEFEKELEYERNRWVERKAHEAGLDEAHWDSLIESDEEWL